MKKYLNGILSVLAITVLAFGSIFWHFSNASERAVHELMEDCLRRGYNASLSMEPGFWKQNIRFSCVANSGIVDEN